MLYQVVSILQVLSCRYYLSCVGAGVLTRPAERSSPGLQREAVQNRRRALLTHPDEDVWAYVARA